MTSATCSRTLREVVLVHLRPQGPACATYAEAAETTEPVRAADALLTDTEDNVNAAQAVGSSTIGEYFEGNVQQPPEVRLVPVIAHQSGGKQPDRARSKSGFARVLAPVVVLVAAVIFSGCKGSDDSSEGPSRESPSPADGLGRRKPSAIEEVPVPETARIAPGGRITGGPYEVDARLYVLPRSVTLHELMEWYMQLGIAGQPWMQTWQWCRDEEELRDPPAPLLVWQRDDRSRALSLEPQIDENDLSRTFGRVVILVGTNSTARETPRGSWPRC